ncbi:MAG TPA: CHAT domain-containing protein [Pyrinomonadaceae bacterium]|jgi:CHAT domain-containing protein
MKLPRQLLLLIALMLWPVLLLHGQSASDPGEMARQLAHEANDNAISLEDRQQALGKLEEAARLFLTVNETLEAARVLNRAGRLQLILSKPQDAVASHSRALDLLTQTPDTQAEVDGLNGLGAAYMLQEKKTGEAQQALQRAISLSEGAGYTAGQAQALLKLSELQNTRNHALALQTAQSALTLWQTLDDKPGLARIYAQIGQCYMAQNALPESRLNYEQSLALWRELNNPPEQAEALISLGFIEHRKGEWSNAISFYTQAQGLIDERAEPQKMGEIAAGLAVAFNENGMPEIGLTQFQRALDYYRQAQNSLYATTIIMRIGVNHYLLGNYSEAIAHIQQALAQVNSDNTLVAECDEYLGRIYIETGEYALALQHLQSALAMYTQAFNPKEAARVQALLGQIAERQEQPERARQYYRLALKTFIKLSDRVNQAAVYYAQGRLELKNRNYDIAEEYLRQSIEATDDMRRVSRSIDLTAAFSATVYERYEKYIECLMQKHELQPSQGLDVRAFEMSDLARARSLAELLRATGTNLLPGLAPQLAQQEKMLRQSLRVKEDYKVALLSRQKYEVEELTALDAELSRLDAEYKQVTETISARYPSYRQITRPTALDLRQIQEQVIADEQTLLLEYSLGENKSYVWAVTRNSITSHELPAQAEIIRAAREVYQLLTVRPDPNGADKVTPAAQELSRMILSPVASELNKSRIVVVADGELNYVPFQILPAPSSGNEMLLAHYEVVNAPSASTLGELRQEEARRQPAAKVLAAFGDPIFAANYASRKDSGSASPVAMQVPDTGHLREALRDVEMNGETFDPSAIQPLFYTTRELDNLSRVGDDGQAFVAAGFAATRDQLLNTDLTQYSILHFATHGLLNNKRPEFSGIVLSTVDRNGQPLNGFVGLQDIYQLRAPVDLVVLSACQTALGKDLRGEGLIGLTRGFMYAGASSVVSSLWKVEDESTAELMRQFYDNMLQQRMPPAAALRAAQNSIRQNPEWRAPYFWAGFILQGEYRQVVKTTPAAHPKISQRNIIAGGAMLSLLAGGAWWYRRRRLRIA